MSKSEIIRILKGSIKEGWIQFEDADIVPLLLENLNDCDLDEFFTNANMTRVLYGQQQQLDDLYDEYQNIY